MEIIEISRVGRFNPRLLHSHDITKMGEVRQPNHPLCGFRSAECRVRIPKTHALNSKAQEAEVGLPHAHLDSPHQGPYTIMASIETMDLGSPRGASLHEGAGSYFLRRL
jgi:hypothetical protein